MCCTLDTSGRKSVAIVITSSLITISYSEYLQNLVVHFNREKPMGPQDYEGIGTLSAARHILLIEESLARRQAFYDVLSRQSSWQVYTACSGQMALVILGYAQPDLVLINCRLPDMAGEALITKTRSFASHVPILIFPDESAKKMDAETLKMVQATLPYAISEELLLATVQLWLSATPLPEQGLPSGTILLIDDEQRMRIIMQNLLELNGFTVVSAASGEEGLEKLPQASPQAVMLDVRMPGMDGLLALKKIRESHPKLPVILVTNVDEPSTREEAMRLGATAYVTKPFNFDGLKEVLRQAIPAKSPVS